MHRVLGYGDASLRASRSSCIRPGLRCLYGSKGYHPPPYRVGYRAPLLSRAASQESESVPLKRNIPQIILGTLLI